MNDKACGVKQRYLLCCSRRGILEPEAGTARLNSFLQTADDRRFGTDLLNISKCFLLDCSQATLNITFGRLRVGKIACLVVIDNFCIAVEVELELLANFVVGATFENKMLSTGQLGSLTE